MSLGGSKPNWKYYKKYTDYSATVRWAAVAAGLMVPLRATIDVPIYILVIPYFKNKVHCDPGNVQKGICDALFWESKEQKAMAKMKGTGDKYTGGFFTSPMYDKENPRTEVTVMYINGVKA